MPRGIYDRPTIQERFWSKVSIKRNSECWNWIAGINSRKYGQFGINKKMYKAHRVAWILTYGEIPNGLHVCHHCDNVLCCNPKHLFLGTHVDNMRDKTLKGRTNSNKLNKDQVKQIRKLRKDTNISHNKLAEIYGVSRKCISKILNNLTWNYID